MCKTSFCILEAAVMESFNSVALFETKILFDEEENKESILFKSDTLDTKELDKQLHKAMSKLGYLGYQLVTVSPNGEKFYFQKFENF